MEKLVTTEQPQLPQILRPIATPRQLVEAHKEAVQLIEEALEEGKDYGTIKGTNKPTLLKPGAERLCKAFGTYAEYAILEKEIQHDYMNTFEKRTWQNGRQITTPGESRGLYRYVVGCTIYSFDKRAVGHSVGSCSTLESKYISRPHEVENTILKMAQKRALVGATLNAFGLSDRFTQDIEDHKETPQAPTIDPHEKLRSELKLRSVPTDKWDRIIFAMKGKYLKDLPDVIEQALKEHAHETAATSPAAGIFAN